MLFILYPVPVNIPVLELLYCIQYSMHENSISITYGAGRPRQRPRLRVTGPLSIDAMTKIDVFLMFSGLLN